MLSSQIGSRFGTVGYRFRTHSSEQVSEHPRIEHHLDERSGRTRHRVLLPVCTLAPIAHKLVPSPAL